MTLPCGLKLRNRAQYLNRTDASVEMFQLNINKC
jgi:hypothetical protein